MKCTNCGIDNTKWIKELNEISVEGEILFCHMCLFPLDIKSIDSERVSNEKLREVINEVNEKIRDDPETQKRMEDLSRELSTLTPEDLHKRMRESIKSDTKRIKP